MKKIYLIMISILSSILGFSACNSKHILPPLEFQKALEQDFVQLVDVRTPEEFQDGHIANARLMNFKDTASFLTGQATLDKSKPVYIYCRSGARSQAATALLTKAGFKVLDLEGGILNWKKNNLPIETGPPISSIPNSYECYLPDKEKPLLKSSLILKADYKMENKIWNFESRLWEKKDLKGSWSYGGNNTILLNYTGEDPYLNPIAQIDFSSMTITIDSPNGKLVYKAVH